jgi:integrase
MMKSSRRRAKHNARNLTLPELEQSKTSVLNTLGSLQSRRSYQHAMDDFIAWYCSEPRLALNRVVVLRYRMHLESLDLAPGTINQRLAAVRRLAYEASDSGLLSPELVAGIRRVKGVKRLGQPVGNWLTAEEGQQLLGAVRTDTLRGKRDAAMLGLLLGCGLRRSEVANLEIEKIQRRDGHWAIAHFVGKGGHVRTVPVPLWVKGAIDSWSSAAGIGEGRLFRAIRKNGALWASGVTQNVV